MTAAVRAPVLRVGVAVNTAAPGRRVPCLQLAGRHLSAVGEQRAGLGAKLPWLRIADAPVGSTVISEIRPNDRKPHNRIEQ